MALSASLALLTSLAGSVGVVSHVAAKPTAPGVLCKTYPDVPECAGKTVSCTFCHDAIDPPSWNAFGRAIGVALEPGAFETGLPDALAAIEDVDADGDGVSNLDELRAGTLPGDPRSVAKPASDAGVTPGTGEPMPAGELPPGYDLEFAYRRVTTLYCGGSPSYEELRAFVAVIEDEAAARTKLHETLSRCLTSDYWQQNALQRLADKRIKPQGSIGPDTQIKLGPLRLVIGDYDYDYRLWRYIMSGDRDMRELLTADYHVEEAADGTLTTTRAVIPKPDRMAFAGGQPLAPAWRAGMITTQWFLSVNTMFSALPRTTAAQAYRAYLGADISAGEGLIPVANEPSDIDKKGVAEARCANCHSTLDPLAYAFAKYEGIELNYGLSIGGYRPERAKGRIPGWDDANQKPFLLGKPVNDLLEWAKVAVASDEFKRNLSEMFFTHALGRKPQPADQAEFNRLWRSLPEDGFSANRHIHRLVDTSSFGAP